MGSAIGSSYRGRAELPRLLAAGLVGIADHDVGGAIGPRELSEHDADRPRAGDQHARTAVEGRLADRGDADGQRLTQRRGIVGHRIGHSMGVPRSDGDVIAERTIDRRGAEEPHVRAQVVVASSGLLAVGVGPLRLDRHPLSDALAVHALTDADDRACRLVAEHQRGVDDEAAHPAVPVVVGVRPADPDRRHPDQHVAGPRRGYRPLLHLDPTWLDEYGGPHVGIRRKCCVRHNLHANVMSIYSHL